MAVVININGKGQSIGVSPDTPLLWVIRDHLELTGTKYGCGLAQCGACTVHMNGTAIRSCVTPVSAAVGSEITTIEGADSEVAKTVKASWEKIQVPQCGYCQSGQVMSATALLENNANPSDEDIDAAMSGNICRCATYGRIRDAIKDASENLKG